MYMFRMKNLEVGKEPIFLCTVVEENVKTTMSQAEKAIKNGADCIELRIDKLKNKSMIKEAIEEMKYPALVVCRPKHLDGFFDGSEKERIELLLEALNYKPDAIDIEYTTDESFRQKVINKAKEKNVPVIICYENFEKTPTKEELLRILKDEEKLGADIAKIAVKSFSLEDTLNVLQVALESKKELKIPFVVIAMGNYGSVSRIYSLILGASMTYCAVEKGKEGAPGQLPVADTKRIYELLKIK